MNVSIIGAGVAGLTCATELVDRGVAVTIFEQSDSLGDSACSWYAGGMLAPWCEQESAEAIVCEYGQQALGWWAGHVDNLITNGSLVVSIQRDQAEVRRFARLTSNHRWLKREDIEALEPDLADRFEQGLHFPDEAHLNPREALQQLASRLSDRGVSIGFGQNVDARDCHADRVIDCRGFAARDQLSQLRGVKGEMLLLSSRDIRLSRPVRLLHPRYPIYLVPRENGLIMLGATMIENDERERVSALSVLELLSAAYALHPGFGEAEIVEMGADVRPAFEDNLPKLLRHEKILYLNGLYRHGFLLAPAMAVKVAEAVTNEASFEELPQCA